MQYLEINFEKQVLELFEEQIGKFGLRETGGVLLGTTKDKIVNVKKASNGGPKAIHRRDYFRADPDYIDMFLEMELANSGEKIRYLGEWHSHPQRIPEPSGKDIISLSEIASSHDNSTILVIIGAIGFNGKKINSQSLSLVSENGGEFYEIEIIKNG